MYTYFIVMYVCMYMRAYISIYYSISARNNFMYLPDCMRKKKETLT